LQALGVGTCRVDLVPREEKLKKAAERKKRHVFFAAAIVLVAIGLAHFLIRGRTAELEASLKQAVAVQKDNFPHERDVEKLEKESTEQLRNMQASLLRIGEARPGALQALRILEEVLAGLPDAAAVEASVTTADQEAGATAAADKAREALKEKLWIPYLRVELTQWPEPAAGQRRTAAARPRPGAKPEVETSVPAYKVTAFAVITIRATDTESNEFIRQKLQEPLRQALEKTGSGTVVKDVQIGLAKSNLPTPFFDPEKEAGPTVEYDDRPFYGAPVTFWMVPRPPTPPAEPKAEEKTEAAPKPPQRARR
jgi:hypothetical protein